MNRLPPGPVPDVPFIDQVRATPKYACPCGARRSFGASGTTGRCGCAMRAGGKQWTDEDSRPVEPLPDVIRQQLRTLSEDQLQHLKAVAKDRHHRLRITAEIYRRRRAKAKP